MRFSKWRVLYWMFFADKSQDYATITELICLANMEAINSEFINDQIPQAERLMKLNRIAISQMRILSEVSGRKLLADYEAQEK